MRAAGNDTAWPDAVRVSDAERDLAISELRERFAEGRLSQDTFVRRMDAVLRCKLRDELSALLADLPRAGRRAGITAAALAEALRGMRLFRAAQLFRGKPRRPVPTELVLPRAGRGPLVIGRNADCDRVLGNSTVSGYHAELDRASDGWLLSDLGSTNGTRLNGWRVRDPVAIQAGDKVSFGAMTFVLCDRARRH